MLASDSYSDDDKAQSTTTSPSYLVCEKGIAKPVSPSSVLKVNLSSTNSSHLSPYQSVSPANHITNQQH